MFKFIHVVLPWGLLQHPGGDEQVNAKHGLTLGFAKMASVAEACGPQNLASSMILGFKPFQIYWINCLIFCSGARGISLPTGGKWQSNVSSGDPVASLATGATPF